MSPVVEGHLGGHRPSAVPRITASYRPGGPHVRTFRMTLASVGRTLSLLLSLCMALGFLGALAPGARAAGQADQKPAKSEKSGQSEQALKADRAAKAGKEA